MASVCVVDEVLSSGYALSDLDDMSPARRLGTATIRRLKKRKSYTGAMVAIGGTIVAIIATAGILAAGDSRQFTKQCGRLEPAVGSLAAAPGKFNYSAIPQLGKIVAPGDPNNPDDGFSSVAQAHSWPWIVLLGYQADSEKDKPCSERQVKALCGGTLITKRHVVSKEISKENHIIIIIIITTTCFGPGRQRRSDAALTNSWPTQQWPPPLQAGHIS